MCFNHHGNGKGWIVKDNTVLHSVLLIALNGSYLWPPFLEAKCETFQESGSLDLSHGSDAHLNPWQPFHCYLPPKSVFGAHKGLISDQLNWSFGDLYHKLLFFSKALLPNTIDFSWQWETKWRPVVHLRLNISVFWRNKYVTLPECQMKCEPHFSLK